jgi:hypothetical protein
MRLKFSNITFYSILREDLDKNQVLWDQVTKKYAADHS